MIKDKLTELYNTLEENESLSGISIKSFERPETLGDDETSIVIRPVGPPMQTAHGSNTSLAKTFLYQVNVESKNFMECKELQRKIEKIMEDQGFYQTVGGLDEWIPEIKRYVDARTYKGQSTLYEEY
nr:MAG TPA: tail component [Caudoviricetes sp.]